MKGCSWRLMVLVVLLVALPAAAGDRFILRAPAAAVGGISGRHGLTLVRPLDNHDHGIFLVLGPDGAAPQQVVDDVKADPEVADFERDGNVFVPEIPLGLGLNQSTASIFDAVSKSTVVTYFGNSVLSAYVNQPAVSLTRIADAQRYFATGAGIVAIVDTGVDPNHPVLASSLVPGYDFVHELPGQASELSDLNQSTASILDQSTASILDQNMILVLNQSTASILDQSTASILDTGQLPAAFGHGTMVAGIVHLVAPTAQIMPLKAFAADGTSDVFNILRAIYYAAENGARVINMSFSLQESSSELMRAVNFATGRGVICVSSVGNFGKEVLVYPAALQTVLGVASTNNADQRSAFSNFGAALADMAAPGEGIITTYPGKHYAAAWGTSFSAPLVSGGAALLVQINPKTEQFDAAEAFAHAKKVSDDLGYGRLDLFLACQSRAK